MICPSCQRETEPGPICSACGALQPLPPNAGPFQLLGIERRFALDVASLEERVKDLQRRLHPDRFARREPAERRLSLAWTTAVNDAWRTLKDPAQRAAAILREYGVEVERSGGRTRQLAPMFLEQVMEQREALAEARAEKDLARARSLAAAVAEQARAAEGRVAEALASIDGGGGPAAIERAADEVVALQYFKRFQEEARALELEALEA